MRRDASEDRLGWLQEWYHSNCNGDWEHFYGIKIDTLDNPGWSLTIDLTETMIENKSFDNFYVERAEDDWIFCRIENQKFKVSCSSLNLLEAIDIFRNWAG